MQRSHQIKVGLFVTLGLVVLGISLFFFGGERAFFTRQIILKAEFDEVQGLAKGSVVSLSGVVIGNVADINFIPERNTLEVIMKIDSTYHERITEGSEVDIRTQGALGDKYIFITPGVVSKIPVKEDSVLPRASGKDFIGKILSKTENVDRAFEIIDEINRLVKNINKNGNVERIINNLLTASDKLNRTLNSSENLIQELKAQYPENKQIKASISHLESILQKIDKGEGSLGALINDPAIHEQLKSILGSSSRSKYLKSLIKSSIEKSDQEPAK